MGAAHMIIASTRNTTRWMWPTPRRIGSSGAAHLLQREADQERDQQGLQHLTGGQRR